MAINFEKYAARGNEFLHILAEKLGNRDDKGHAGRVLRSVFRVLRSYISVEESIQLLAQLPMALKGIYVDGWQPGKRHKRIKSMEGFARAVLAENGGASERDFNDVDDVIRCLRAFVETLELFATKNELEEAFGTLPKPLSAVFESWLTERTAL